MAKSHSMAAGADQPPELLIDFDYTLFCSNSTEQFIAFCRPSLLIALLDFVLRTCIPWKLLRDTNRSRIKDWVCCTVILVLTPWNYFRWRRAAPALFAQLRNRSIEEEVRAIDHGRIVVVTFGMRGIVAALLQNTEWERARLVATPFLPSPRLFYRGKHAILRNHFDTEVIAGAICISDSEDDRDLLDRTRGRLIDRQGPLYSAGQVLYMPFRYMAVGKYTRSYTIDQILFVDIALAILATAWDLRSLVLNALTLPLFVLSTLTIYEIGYFDNDVKAAKREARPTLKECAARFLQYPIEPGAWVWAIAFAVAGTLVGWGVGLFATSGLPYVAIFWALSLIAVRGMFHVYNSVSERRRIYLYPLLQMSKFLWPFFLIPLTAPGTVLVVAHIGAMWAIYLVYRLGGNQRDVSRETVRAILGVTGFALLAPLAATGKIDAAFAIAVGTLWLVLRVVKERAMARLKRHD